MKAPLFDTVYVALYRVVALRVPPGWFYWDERSQLIVDVWSDIVDDIPPTIEGVVAREVLVPAVDRQRAQPDPRPSIDSKIDAMWSSALRQRLEWVGAGAPVLTFERMLDPRPDTRGRRLSQVDRWVRQAVVKEPE